MNKKIALLLPIFLFPITGCSDNGFNVQLTYGTLVDKEAIQLDSSTFETMVANKESFLLAIYPNGSTCSCWRNFSYIINEAVNDAHLMVYKFYAEDVAANQTMRKMTGFYSYNDRPTFYVLKEGQLVKAYDYSDQNPLYHEYSSFIEEVEKRCKYPKLMKIDEDYLNTVIRDKALIYYARNKCSDCNYATPNTVVPYIANNNLKDYIYFMDIQYLYEDKEAYQTFKDNHLLSEKNNPTLGFGTGVVPTFQYYEGGTLKDMCVYFNDGELTYNKEENKYYATNSYYSAERINGLHYLDTVSVKDLTKVAFNENEVMKFGEHAYLKNDASNKYHSVILNAFFKTYLN